MDMETILEGLYDMVVEPDTARIKAQRQCVEAAEPYYKRLCAMAGKEEGDKIWDAALMIGAEEEAAIFHAGLRLGMQLMTLCL